VRRWRARTLSGSEIRRLLAIVVCSQQQTFLKEIQKRKILKMLDEVKGSLVQPTGVALAGAALGSAPATSPPAPAPPPALAPAAAAGEGAAADAEPPLRAGAFVWQGNVRPRRDPVAGYRLRGASAMSAGTGVMVPPPI
jgi:hypothetical protein